MYAPYKSNIEPILPRIGHPAPAFEANSTMGLVRLDDYAGKWLKMQKNSMHKILLPSDSNQRVQIYYEKHYRC